LLKSEMPRLPRNLIGNCLLSIWRSPATVTC
jgi:hypothetical protein